MSWEDYLKKVYYDPSTAGSFTGVDKLCRYVQKEGKYDISKYKVRKWLQRQEPYSLQRPMRRHYRRNQVVVAGLDDQWDADLTDMTKFSKENEGVQFDHNIEHFYSQNTEVKANYAERAIKTIKTKMYRYMTFKQSQRYIDRLQEFAQSYNKTYHRTIDTEPELVRPNNEEEVRVSTFLSREEISRKQSKRPYKFKVGDKVRISKISSIFDREYDQKWSGEIFIVFRRFLRNGIPVYKLKDYNDEAITGTFYQPELQKVDVRDEDTFKIEKILKTRGRGPNKQYFVKWLHWPKKFNSWINADDMAA
ncbi:uncharacterized protein LOC134280919 [Saccostrea cucullata]|uniref:uncharacterized protein LOC134280919 n=1 Tax=Saccostrea cuccullata TaxID=36930 RepID=UPI002ED34029